MKVSLFIFILFATYLLGCRPLENQTGSDPAGMIANRSADGGMSSGVKNVALVILGDSDGIPGTAVDFQRMPGIFKQLGFEVVTLKYPSSAQVKSTITQIASDMARADGPAMANMQRGGTFAIYFSSHGGPDGSTSLGGGSDFINMGGIAQAARQGRGGVPFQRFITMFDTCFSESNKGGLANANQAGGGLPGLFGGLGLPNGQAPGTFVGNNGVLSSDQISQFANGNMNELRSFSGLYLSSFAWFSSRSFESSGDTGAGGPATIAFANAVNAAMGGGGNIGGLGGLFGGGLGLADEQPVSQTQVSPQAAAQILGASHYVVSPQTLGGIGQAMLRSVYSQHPVVCAHPPQTFNEFLVDPPVGVLPALITNVDGIRNNQQDCMGD